jgi:hypothetical protein
MMAICGIPDWGLPMQAHGNSKPGEQQNVAHVTVLCSVSLLVVPNSLQKSLATQPDAYRG